MVTIKLARFGKKKQPSYRIIVVEKHKDPLGDYIESIGHVNYFGGQKNITVNKERAEHWLSVGAQPTNTVHNLFVNEGISKDTKRKPDGVRKSKAELAAEAAKAVEEAAKAKEAAEAPNTSTEETTETKEKQTEAEENNKESEVVDTPEEKSETDEKKEDKE